ncbi:MAG: hypothetical protein HDKAJFGB_03321 [Anaerolineae bacterium]|nr:hypothetical protein [Anaerolineae bacterium]
MRRQNRERSCPLLETLFTQSNVGPPSANDKMNLPINDWPYPLTLQRLALALAIGLFVGLERERRGKESGLRTFAFVALLGCLGGLLGEAYALMTIVSTIVLIVILNLQTLRANQTAELTTSAALLLINIAGILCGMGHTLTPVAIGVAVAALLAWKERLSGFSLHLTESELRSAILLAILALVIYPALPDGSIDPWHVLVPRDVLVIVILIAGIGFVNYILWKMYGTRGIELTGFLGGLVNSSVAVSELAARVRETDGQLIDVAFRGSLLATAAMIVRNGALLALIAPHALLYALLPLGLMLASCSLFIILARHTPSPDADTPLLHLESPFSLQAALKLALVFLALQIISVIALDLLGQIGVYVTSFLGGLISSASATASAAALAANGTIPDNVAGISVVLTTFASALSNLPFIFRANQPKLIRRLTWATAVILVFGIIGALIAIFVLPNLTQWVAPS